MICKNYKAVENFPQGLFFWYQQCKNIESYYRRYKVPDSDCIKNSKDCSTDFRWSGRPVQDCTGVAEISTGKYERGDSGLTGGEETTVKLSLTSAEEIATAEFLTKKKILNNLAPSGQ